jgi:hypothetical protein
MKVPHAMMMAQAAEFCEKQQNESILVMLLTIQTSNQPIASGNLDPRPWPKDACCGALKP